MVALPRRRANRQPLKMHRPQRESTTKRAREKMAREKERREKTTRERMVEVIIIGRTENGPKAARRADQHRRGRRSRPHGQQRHGRDVCGRHSLRGNTKAPQRDPVPTRPSLRPGLRQPRGVAYQDHIRERRAIKKEALDLQPVYTPERVTAARVRGKTVAKGILPSTVHLQQGKKAEPQQQEPAPERGALALCHHLRHLLVRQGCVRRPGPRMIPGVSSDQLTQARMNRTLSGHAQPPGMLRHRQGPLNRGRLPTPVPAKAKGSRVPLRAQAKGSRRARTMTICRLLGRSIIAKSIASTTSGTPRPGSRAGSGPSEALGGEQGIRTHVHTAACNAFGWKIIETNGMSWGCPDQWGIEYDTPTPS
mmetsp:Transcript_70386/g.128972  ORF Transcript_70386/g.128972 Transcript_70386/m.128972 type:complete len:365 (-) Transcript_70386:5-1099(-)